MNCLVPALQPLTLVWETGQLRISNTYQKKRNCYNGDIIYDRIMQEYNTDLSILPDFMAEMRFELDPNEWKMLQIYLSRAVKMAWAKIWKQKSRCCLEKQWLICCLLHVFNMCYKMDNFMENSECLAMKFQPWRKVHYEMIYFPLLFLFFPMTFINTIMVINLNVY